MLLLLPPVSSGGGRWQIAAWLLASSFLANAASSVDSGEDTGLAGLVQVNMEGDLLLASPTGRVIINGIDVLAKLQALRDQLQMLQVGCK